MSFFPWNNPETPSRTFSGLNETETGAGVMRPPASRPEWLAEYERRRATMYGEPYSLGEVIAYQMYRAEDEGAGEYSPQSLPMREDGSTRFVQQVNAQGVFRGSPQLQLSDAAQEAGLALDPGEEVWQASKVGRCSPWWARLLSGMGELCLEVVRMEEGAVVVAYDPEMVMPEFDTQTGTKLVRVTMLAPYLDPDETDEFGRPTGGAAVVRTYKRVVDAERIDVWVDGEYREEESGPHGLGEIPVAWLTWDAMPGDPIHGVPSSHGMDGRVARVDSISCQIDAVTKRYANPIPYLRGAKTDGNAGDMFKLGRLVEIPNAAGALEYLEPTMEGIRVLMELQKAKVDAIAATRPEFIFHGAGAGASGEALKVRAAQYVSKVEEVRGAVFESLARLVELGVQMNTGAAIERGSYVVTAPPVLPIDMVAAIDRLVKAASLGLLEEDVAAEFQRLGLVDRGADPTEYAREMMDRAAQNGLTFNLGGALPGEG